MYSEQTTFNLAPGQTGQPQAPPRGPTAGLQRRGGGQQPHVGGGPARPLPMLPVEKDKAARPRGPHLLGGGHSRAAAGTAWCGCGTRPRRGAPGTPRTWCRGRCPACSGRWRPLGQRCTGFSRSPGTQPQQTCPRMENTTLVRPGWRGLDRSPFPEGRESGPTDGKGAGRVKGLGKPWAPLLSPDEDNSASPLTYIGVPGGYYLKKHIRAPSPKGTPAVLIPCSCHLLRLLGTELPGVQPG